LSVVVVGSGMDKDKVGLLAHDVITFHAIQDSIDAKASIALVSARITLSVDKNRSYQSDTMYLFWSLFSPLTCEPMKRTFWPSVRVN
jgi:hypothetical protein